VSFASSYTGGTIVNGGTLAVSLDSNLGGAAGGLTLDGGTLATTASFSSARTVSLGRAAALSRPAPARPSPGAAASRAAAASASRAPEPWS
jgi:fibronectin-binding autotransporter adhesin